MAFSVLRYGVQRSALWRSAFCVMAFSVRHYSRNCLFHWCSLRLCRTKFYYSIIPFNPSILQSFIPSFLQSFNPSFLHSFIPSFLHSFIKSLYIHFTNEKSCLWGNKGLLGKRRKTKSYTPAWLIGILHSNTAIFFSERERFISSICVGAST